MVLTHEDATDEEKMPYLAIRCHPLVVKEFFGRAAKREPPCPAAEDIWWGWKDSPHESILSSMHEILCGWPSPAPVSLIMYQAEPCACEFVATLFFEHKPKHRCTHNT